MAPPEQRHAERVEQLDRLREVEERLGPRARGDDRVAGDRHQVRGHVAAELALAVHAPDPAGGEDPHPGGVGHGQRRRDRRDAVAAGGRDDREVPLGDLAVGRQHPLDVVADDPDLPTAAEHGHHRRDRAGVADRGRAAPEGLGVGRGRQPEARVDRRLHRHDGAAAGERVGDLGLDGQVGMGHGGPPRFAAPLGAPAVPSVAAAARWPAAHATSGGRAARPVGDERTGEDVAGAGGVADPGDRRWGDDLAAPAVVHDRRRPGAGLDDEAPTGRRVDRRQVGRRGLLDVGEHDRRRELVEERGDRRRPSCSTAEDAARSIVARPPAARTVATASRRCRRGRRAEEAVQRDVDDVGARQVDHVDAASSAAAARSGNIVRSPSASTSTTTQPVRPPRWRRTSTPARARSASRARPVASSPTRPMNRAVAPAVTAAMATVAPLPPRARCTAAGLSVPRRVGPAVHTTTSSTRSPMTVTFGGRWSVTGRRSAAGAWCGRISGRRAALRCRRPSGSCRSSGGCLGRQVHRVVGQPGLVGHRGPVGEDDVRVALDEQRRAAR